ncbi:MAG: hypothetical protein GQE15_26905 [Archangiaceae bacterium]|nr:hypothetical protein [Archangiaceae bacterium]
MLDALLAIALLHPFEDPHVLQPPAVVVTRTAPRLTRERMNALLAFPTATELTRAERQIAMLALQYLSEGVPCSCSGDDEPAALAAELFTILTHQRFMSPRTSQWALFAGWATWAHGSVHGSAEATARALDEGVEAVGLAMATGVEPPPEFAWAALEAIAQWEAVTP